MQAQPAARFKIILAFATLYLVWGSTFLAIRIGVQAVPPLLFAGFRFFTAGAILFAFTRARREPLPTRAQWASIASLSALIFLFNYGLLFWAEQRVPSGVAAVMLATIPAFTALAEIALLRTRRLSLPLATALALGLTGVAILTTGHFGAPARIANSPSIANSPVDPLGAAALLLSAAAWSLGSALTRRLPLPASKATSSGAQMLLGGLFLFLASASFGELPHFHPTHVPPAAWFALAYLILAGSLIGFTTYLWLIHRESPTRVATYAYVNPLVAVLLGTLLAHEPLAPRTLFGSAFILLSVILITITPAQKAV